jgi:hypothetical protein
MKHRREVTAISARPKQEKIKRQAKNENNEKQVHRETRDLHHGLTAHEE